LADIPVPINESLFQEWGQTQELSGIVKSQAWLQFFRSLSGYKAEYYADQITLDTAVGGVTHTISSIGFQPSCAIVFACMDGGGVPASFGFGTYDSVYGRSEMSVYNTHAAVANTWSSNTYIATLVQGAGTIGYLHTWTPKPGSVVFTYDKIGLPVGTAVASVLLIK
jgi:hypothetical protein